MTRGALKLKTDNAFYKPKCVAIITINYVEIYIYIII